MVIVLRFVDILSRKTNFLYLRIHACVEKPNTMILHSVFLKKTMIMISNIEHQPDICNGKWLVPYRLPRYECTTARNRQIRKELIELPS